MNFHFYFYFEQIVEHIQCLCLSCEGTTVLSVTPFFKSSGLFCLNTPGIRKSKPTGSSAGHLRDDRIVIQWGIITNYNKVEQDG